MTTLLLSALLALPACAARRPAKPSRAAEKAFAGAVVLYEQAEFDLALQKFNTAEALFPGWKTAAAYRAMCRWTMGDLRGAAADAAAGLRLKPNSPESFVARGKARLVTRDDDGALEDFRAAVALDPENAEAHFGVGSALSAKGETAGALKALDNAVRLNPDFAAALLVRGTVKDKIRDFGGAVKDYTRVLQINPRFGWARFYRGKSLREIKDYRNSLADLNEFIDANPDREDALYLRSNVKFLLSDYQGAIDDLSKVIELDPRKGLAYTNRGQARSLVGDKEGALADLKRALELEPARRDKIQAAIDGLQASGAPAPQPINPGADRREMAPSEGEAGFLGAPNRPRPPAENTNTVTIEDETERGRINRPPPKAPEMDDDLAPKPSPTIQLGPKKTPAEESSGQDDSNFIQ